MMIGYAEQNISVNAEQIRHKFDEFTAIAEPYLHIANKETYESALIFVEQLFNDGQNILADIITTAIENYENSLEEVIAFDAEVDEIDSGISTLRLLMDQHNLKNKDMKELIGSESLVSMILNGDRELTRNHIAKLSRHFKINPSLFFNTI